ncbi:MAG TPA: sigma-70 family RNA polymerase sigma factor [Gemmatimonadaceae bacterium]|nr:sigma-70 family RNA polymerase sigma factor [Gemmatimonadaceae bacterium]
MTDTHSATKSLLGLPVPPPPLDGGGASQPLVTAEEGYALRVAREKEFVDRIVPHSELLLACARSRLGSEADAENAVQDVMGKMWDKGDVVAICGGDDDHIQAYLLRAIENRVNDVFRHRGRERDLETEFTQFQRSRTNNAVPPWEDTVATEILEATYRALQELSWIHREVFRLVKLLDVKPAVAAQALEMNVNTLRVRLTESIRHLRKRLAPYAPNAGGGRKEDTP